LLLNPGYKYSYILTYLLNGSDEAQLYQTAKPYWPSFIWLQRESYVKSNAAT